MSGDILGDDERLLESLLPLCEELDAQQATLAEGLERLDALQHRSRYLLLVHDLGNRLIEAQREWLDHVERELGK